MYLKTSAGIFVSELSHFAMIHVLCYYAGGVITMPWCSFDKYLSEIIAWGWFHFSIGRVNSELYALGSGTWNLESINVENRQTQLNMQSWMRDYVNVLCINSWQVLI